MKLPAAVPLVTDVHWILRSSAIPVSAVGLTTEPFGNTLPPHLRSQRATALDTVRRAVMMEINGVAHIILKVSQWAKCRPFYEALLPFLGLKCVFSGNDNIYYVGGRTAVGVGPCDEKYAGQRFVQGSVGLHHVCFRCRSREDVDSLYLFLKKLNVRIVHPPEEGPWAPGYYSILFEDPAGIRLEINHVPGKGVLKEGSHFNPAGDYQ
jgi:catechol 2,3-dioxygenase-like lactoylglutathione lyase family enzyme